MSQESPTTSKSSSLFERIAELEAENADLRLQVHQLKFKTNRDNRKQQCEYPCDCC